MTDYTVMTHPLIQHKISKLRDKNTGTAEFRALVEEIAMLMGYEALKDLPTEDVCIETPIEECMTPVIAGRNLAIVPFSPCRTWNGQWTSGSGSYSQDWTSVCTETRRLMNLTSTTASSLILSMRDL